MIHSRALHALQCATMHTFIKNMQKIKIQKKSVAWYFGKTTKNGVITIKARHGYTPSGHVTALPRGMVLNYLMGKY